MPRHTESEFKLRAERLIEVAAVDAALRELGATCRLNDSRVHIDTYFDDARGSLRRAGIALRTRTTRQGTELTCKLEAEPHEGLFVRTELEAPWAGEQPPHNAAQLTAELRDAVEPFVLGRDLEGRQRLEVHREIRMLTQAGHDICELAFDSVTATADGRSACFQEIELEVLDDKASNQRLANALRERLGLRFSERDKPGHAAAMLGVEHGNGRAEGRGPADTITAALGRGLSTRLLAMRRAEIGVREGRDPEPLRGMCAATRRMHGVIDAFRELWPEGTASRLLEHLDATERQLDVVRDLDVMLARLPDDLALLPARLQGAGQRVIEWIEGQRETAHRQLVRWLTSAARLTAAARLEDELQEIGFGTGAADEPTVRAAPRRLAQAVSELRRLITGAASELDSGAAHGLRMHARRVRYLAEEFADLPGFDYDKSVRAIARVQQTLDLVRDRDNAAERLLGWVHTAASASADGAWTAAALGGLAANCCTAARAARDAFQPTLARADRKRVWRRFQP